MPGVDAWCALADEVAAADDPALQSRTESALIALGLTDPDRTALLETIRGREDPAGLLLAQVAANAHTNISGAASDAGSASPDQMDAALGGRLLGRPT